MVKSTDIARSYVEYDRDRIRRLVRQYDAKRDFVKKEVLPRVGILGVLAGWSVLSALNNVLNHKR